MRSGLRQYQARHVAGRPAGPVTVTFRAISAPHPWQLAAAARAWPLLPVLALIRPLLAGRNPVAWADAVLGYDAVLCLLACLAVTPFMTVARVRVSRLRWWYGMWMFALAAAALAFHALAIPGPLAPRMAGDVVNWTGLVIVVLLFPLAATSSAAAQRLLGPEWKRWQRGLIWAVWALTAIHLGVLHDWVSLAAFGGASAPAIVLRRGRVRRAVKRWRSGGYATGGWWAAVAVLGTCFAAGAAVIAAGEVTAVASAITLT